MGMRTSIGRGRAIPGVLDAFMAPARHPADGPIPAVLLAPGRGNPTPTSWLGHPAAIVAAERFVLTAVDLGGRCWGNPESRARLDQARAWAARELTATIDRVALWGVSMGALSLLPWAAEHTHQVSGIVLVAPCVDPPSKYAQNEIYRRELEAAFGGGCEPQELVPAGSLAGVPIQVWSGGRDEVCPEASLASFIETCGAEVEHHVAPTANHVEALMSAEPAAVVDFLERTFALSPA